VLDFVDPDRAGRWSGHPRRPARFAMKPEGRRRWTIRRKAVPAEFVAAVWGAMQATPQHTYQILTKRPDRMADITASLPVLPIVARDSRAPIILGASATCARSMLPSGLFRSSLYSGPWLGPI
jgi:hypothetical protein